ncbi:hypothetical protein Vafri_12735, partial [Volvox africanus]
PSPSTGPDDVGAVARSGSTFHACNVPPAPSPAAVGAAAWPPAVGTTVPSGRCSCVALCSMEEFMSAQPPPESSSCAEPCRWPTAACACSRSSASKSSGMPLLMRLKRLLLRMLASMLAADGAAPGLVIPAPPLALK